MIKGFLLDIDGTLVDSNEGHVIAWEYAFKNFGYDITRDEIRSLIGMGGDRLLPTVIPGLDPDTGKGKEILEFRKKFFLETIVSDLKPTPGARELILALQQKGIKLVVATSSSKEELTFLLEKAQVADVLNVFVTKDDVENSKPAPDLVNVALKKIELSSDEVYMLGDTPYDIAAAKKVGVKTVALRCGGFSDEQLKGAVRVFDDPSALLKQVDVLLNNTKKDSVDLQWEKIAEEKQGKEIIKTFRFPDGSIKIFPIRNEGKGTSIFALTEDKKVIMVKQFRPGPEKLLLDLPGGYIDKNESPLDAARRELLEETGYSGEFKDLGINLPSAYSNEEIYCFLATKCRKVTEPKPDKGEFMNVELVDILELKKIIKNGEVTNPIAAYRAFEEPMLKNF